VKSRRGLWASVALLLALPVAVLAQVLLGIASETVVHAVGAIGFVLLALAFFDFALPRWVAAAGCAAAAGMAAIFALQGLSTVLHDDALSHFANQTLGNHPERIAIDALLVCLLAVCLAESRGTRRALGVLSLLAVVAVEAYRISLLLSGAPESASLRLVYLLPFVWLLLESRMDGSPRQPGLREQVA
jgi:hypothetical protein